MSKRKRDADPTKSNDVFLTMASHISPIKPNGKNFVFSPLSLRSVVSLIAAGASGQTLQELLAFLNSDSIDDVNTLSSKLFSAVLTTASAGGPTISFANGLWIQEGRSLTPSFKQVADNVYQASCHQIDFANGNADGIISELNSWAEEQTNGLIKQVFSPGKFDRLTMLVLANALYFKGKWDEKYFKASKKEEKFHLLGGDSVKIPFMTSDWRHCIRTFDDFKVLRLPYKQGEDDGRQFSMYIFLPDSKDGLPALAEKVASEPDFLDRHLPYHEWVLVNRFRLPRFKISFGFTASEVLEKLGVSMPFNDGAELTEMVVDLDEELKVSEICQKCFIEVNEEGTKAAVVGRVQLHTTCGRGRRPPPKKIDFVADHPFMFLIREDNSGAVLFFGHVLNPAVEE